jgi:hypothetical protein
MPKYVVVREGPGCCGTIFYLALFFVLLGVCRGLGG